MQNNINFVSEIINFNKNKSSEAPNKYTNWRDEKKVRGIWVKEKRKGEGKRTERALSVKVAKCQDYQIV